MWKQLGKGGGKSFRIAGQKEGRNQRERKYFYAYQQGRGREGKRKNLPERGGRHTSARRTLQEKEGDFDDSSGWREEERKSLYQHGVGGPFSAWRDRRKVTL